MCYVRVSRKSIAFFAWEAFVAAKTPLKTLARSKLKSWFDICGGWEIIKK